MKIVKMKCTGCDSQHTFQNQELDACREKVCERCQIKLTVVSASTEGEAGASLQPHRERRELTKKEADTARRLLVTAFEGDRQ
jgi:hypothetical protein